MDQAAKLRLLIKNRTSEGLPITSQRSIGIYTIASGKGGVGKTNVVVNLAIALQNKGKRVLIIDADLGFANVDVVLGIMPKYTMYDVLFHDRPLKDAIIQGPGGIKVLPGGSGIMEMASLDVEKQERVANQFLALENVDIILIDTGAGLSKNLLSFITFSQEVILVTTPEPTALTDAYSVIKVLAQYKLKERVKMIINRVPNVDIANRTFDNLKKTSDAFLDITLENIGYILDDARVGRSVMNQVPFLIQHPHCLASKGIYSIADEILDQKKQKKKIKSIQEVYNRLIKVFG